MTLCTTLRRPANTSRAKQAASAAACSADSGGTSRVLTEPATWSITQWPNYEEDDLGRFSEVGKHRPDLFEKFMAWYQACQEDGALSRREKALIGLAVAHALQCPYCIDAFSQSCLEAGSNMEQMTEAIHMASALRGGASLVHGV
jgi:alkylhydroperoxidase/carboxymuconolactone decarboxylase family protein